MIEPGHIGTVVVADARLPELRLREPVSVNLFRAPDGNVGAVAPVIGSTIVGWGADERTAMESWRVVLRERWQFLADLRSVNAIGPGLLDEWLRLQARVAPMEAEPLVHRPRRLQGVGE